jgi:hypothetical protein
MWEQADQAHNLAVLDFRSCGQAEWLQARRVKDLVGRRRRAVSDSVIGGKK